ncbi:ComF family protein [soil metagenome]
MIIDKLIGLVAPHHCLGCGAEGVLLCGWCAPDAISPVSPRCFHCYQISDNSTVCKTCRRHGPLGHVWVASVYEGLAKALITKLKFERAAGASDCVAELMSGSLPYLAGSIVTYVPTASSRRRKRGYDQSELIAKALSRRLGLPFKSLLARSGQSRQVGASREQRARQLADAFRPINVRQLKGSNILLIDDVVTTGATLFQAAKILKQGGAKQINAAVFAQKIG